MRPAAAQQLPAMRQEFPRPLAVLLLSVAAPLFAFGTEGALGMVPCDLCLWQRWPYWAAAIIALFACLRPRGPQQGLILRLAGVAALTSGAIAILHVGVEQGWWPSPLPGCRAPNAGTALTVEEMLRGLTARPNKPCDAPAYLIEGFPLSMAAMNLIYAAAVGAFAFRAASRVSTR